MAVKPKKVRISYPVEIGIHSKEVIRPTGGGKIPLDRYKPRSKKSKIKAIGVKHSGWHLEGSEFDESKGHMGFELPAFSDRRGAWKRVFLILDDHPRVYKILLPSQVVGDFPEKTEEARKVAKTLHEKVPAAKILSSKELSNVSLKGEKKLIVEVHEYVGHFHTNKREIKPKNLWEEELKDKDEFYDVLGQISNIVTTLFHKHKVLYLDAKPDNFSRTSKGKVKIVDLDSIGRTNHKNEPTWVGRALANTVNELLEKNEHLRPKTLFDKRKIKDVVLSNVRKNVKNKDEANKIIKGFNDEVRFKFT
ncbi:MAG: hypothetical protein J7L23_04670 [Candidatus Diapherotrites archaeon]|nr:hypothetical protein [Candidatus Diapherotrites archaeon]